MEEQALTGSGRASRGINILGLLMPVFMGIDLGRDNPILTSSRILVLRTVQRFTGGILEVSPPQSLPGCLL